MRPNYSVQYLNGWIFKVLTVCHASWSTRKSCQYLGIRPLFGNACVQWGQDQSCASANSNHLNVWFWWIIVYVHQKHPELRIYIWVVFIGSTIFVENSIPKIILNKGAVRIVIKDIETRQTTKLVPQQDRALVQCGAKNQSLWRQLSQLTGGRWQDCNCGKICHGRGGGQWQIRHFCALMTISTPKLLDTSYFYFW